MEEETPNTQQAGHLLSNFPVLVPFHPALTFSQDEFERFLQTDLGSHHTVSRTVPKGLQPLLADDDANMDGFSIISSPSTTTNERNADGQMEVDTQSDLETAAKFTTNSSEVVASKDAHPFMKGLQRFTNQPELLRGFGQENKMLTKNGDVAYSSTTEHLVDLFAELEDIIQGPRLQVLLEAAWRVDSVTTLKVIFNSRSIHLGKSSRETFYRCAGWLAQNHPLTLVSNLRWLTRPVINKVAKKEKAGKEDDEFGEMVIVDPIATLDGDDEVATKENDPSRFDVRNGVAHGYWKDLLNILVLSVEGKLGVLANPKEILNKKRIRKPPAKKRQRVSSAAQMPSISRHDKRDLRHEEAIKAFNHEPLYRALHIAIARLFAEQLKSDLDALRGELAAAKRQISLCAKWAPSHKLFHDKHTFIVSSIAEILYPRSKFTDIMSCIDEKEEKERELYLRHAREAYRKDVAALRKHLQVVERDLTAKTLENIKYERVPSVAMKKYTPIFVEKDTERFEAYIDRVAAGKSQISGATLLPSMLIKAVREANSNEFGSGGRGLYRGRGHPMRGRGYSFRGLWKTHRNFAQELKVRKQAISEKALDGQWNSLVQRIKKSGNMASSIAVCDVSGSMSSPVFPDGTCPMDSAIGLSLLVAEVTEPPFGGAFITFSAKPAVQNVDLTASIHEKYQKLQKSNWSMNTDFVAVFEELILPMAVENNIAQEDMVKHVFVFSDMQFDQAQARFYGNNWTTSFERTQKMFTDAGYEMPKLVFWNLAGGSGDHGAPKPVAADEEGTAIVSGYSQGMLKVFMENGSFEGPDEEEVIETEENEDLEGSDNGEVVIQKRKKQKIDPMSTVTRAVSHPAYSMLEVLD